MPLDAGRAICTTSTGGRCAYSVCPGCGSWRLETAGEAVAHHYPAEYYGTSDRKFIGAINRIRDLSWWRRARQVHRLHRGRPGTVLDIGCGDGIFLRNLRARGWRICGTELAGATFERAQRIAGIDLVDAGSGVPLPWAAATMDVITLWHVLEHIPDLEPLLKECHRLLKPGGYLIVEVPDKGSLQARLFGSQWFHLDPPRHVYQFTRKGLRALLARADLPVVKSSGLAVEMGIYGIVQSALNAILAPRDLLFDTWWKGRFGIHWPKEIVSFLGMLVVAPLAVALFLLETAIGAGVVVKYRARKEQ